MSPTNNVKCLAFCLQRYANMYHMFVCICLCNQQQTEVVEQSLKQKHHINYEGNLGSTFVIEEMALKDF